MLSKTAPCSRLVFVRLNSGDDILHSLQALVRERSIRNGAILNGVGSLSQYHVHVVETTRLPPGDVFFKGEGPWDILSLTGLILNGRVHAHITFSNTQTAMGGHLEEGTKVLTFCVVVIADAPEADLADWDRASVPS